MKISRRKFIGFALFSIFGLNLSLQAKIDSLFFSIEPNSEAKFDLPKLKYAYGALELAIDKGTMTIHHQKHHQAHIDQLNTAPAKNPDFQKKNLAYVLSNIAHAPKEWQSTLKNNGGGRYNHTFFWENLSPMKQVPSAKVLKATNKNFQSFESFKKQFKGAGMACFGSGWVWLLQKEDKTLVIKTFPNQDNFLMNSAFSKEKPLLALDLWEHAYYLKYQNRRADYIEKYFELINWSFVECQFNAKR